MTPAAVRLAPIVVALALAACLQGCSPTYHGEQKRVASALKAYDRAERRNDTATVCRRMLTAHYREAISGNVAQCTVFLARTRGPKGLKSIKDVKVDGTTATATIQTEDQSKGTVHLVERHKRWLIATIAFTSLGD